METDYPKIKDDKHILILSISFISTEIVVRVVEIEDTYSTRR